MRSVVEADGGRNGVNLLQGVLQQVPRSLHPHELHVRRERHAGALEKPAGQIVGRDAGATSKLLQTDAGVTGADVIHDRSRALITPVKVSQRVGKQRTHRIEQGGELERPLEDKTAFTERKTRFDCSLGVHQRDPRRRGMPLEQQTGAIEPV
jgi:hypothetical protein